MNPSQIKIEITKCSERLLGKKFTHSLLLKLYLKRFEQNGIIFIHIPKAAGTSISNEIMGKRGGHFSAGEIKEALGEERYRKIFSFSVTRNPYDRLVSAYNFARQGGSKEGGIRKLKVYNSQVFSSFERFVNEWLVFQDLMEIEKIFRPQFQFLYDDDKCLVDSVGKIEEIGFIEEILSEKLKKAVSIEKRNISQREKDYDYYYTVELKATVFNLYRKDFEYFSYSK